MKKEVIYEEGREGDGLSSFCEKFYHEVNEYNNTHKDQAHVVVLACDSKGGASFCIGETEQHVKEFLESAARHDSFRDILVGILKELS